MQTALNEFEQAVAGAIISVDTLWGGDVSSRSGVGRVIADSYFSGKDLPDCYHGDDAASLRKFGGASAKNPDVDSMRGYIKRTRPADLIDAFDQQAQSFPRERKTLVGSLANTLRVQLDLALERIGDGPTVSYERCVISALGVEAKEAKTAFQLERVRALLGALGQQAAAGSAGLVEAVDAYRKQHWVGHEGIAKASQRVISQLEALANKNFAPHLPEALQKVPRSNVTFHMIEDAWFSGSMNYMGRDRKDDGSPCYEAEYEINAKIEKSQAEFVHLVAHEVIPGHVTTFALVQHLYELGQAGFESTILTMNTRMSTLFEGIANAGLLLAHGVPTIEDLPTDELKLGMYLSELEDAAKTNASYFTYVAKMPSDEIKSRLRTDCLATKERANKLTDAWAQHPLMGRAYMPSYRHGTGVVLELLSKHGVAKMIPVLYGARGLCDCVTIHDLLS